MLHNMNDQSTRVKLNICGSDYSVITDDSEEYTISLGQEVDKRIRGMMEDNSRLSVTMAAILCCLSYCDECRKSRENADNLRSQIKDYLEDSSKARLEADDSRREAERLKREIAALRQRLADIENR